MKKSLFWFSCWIVLVQSQTGITQIRPHVQELRFAFGGIVTVANSGEPLPGANILLTPGNRGTITDANGRFGFQAVPAGRYVLTVLFIGYQSYQDTLILNSGKPPFLQIRLHERALEGKEISVTANTADLSGQINLSQKIISSSGLRQGSTLSEPDLLRTLALQPGISSMNDYNSRFYVRGGRGNENHILVDDVTVHNPYHALGFFSTFDTDAIKMVENYRGVAPSRYCERLSSVTNIILRDGHAQGFHGSGMLSLVSSKFLFEGPLLRIDNKTGRKWTWMLSGRRTYFDFIADFPFYFYDVSAKSVYDSGKHTRLIFHGYYGLDRINTGIKDDQTDLRWKNRLAGLHWFQFFSPRFTLMNSLSFSDFTTTINQSESSYDAVIAEVNQLNGIQETNWTSEGHFYPIPQWQFVMGYSLSRFYIDQYLDTFYQTHFKGNWQNFKQHKAYFSLEAAWGPRWHSELGLVWLYLPYNKQQQVVPRAGIEFKITDSWQIEAGFGQHFQALTTINDDYDPLVFFDAWIPSPPDRPIAEAKHWGLGISGKTANLLRVNWEVYYRRYSNLLRFNRVRYQADERFYLDGWAETMGTELELNIDTQRYQGTLNLSLGQATSHFFLRNQPMHHLNDFRWFTFPSPGDIRFAGNFIFSFNFREKWNLALTGIFQSGKPYTAFIGSMQDMYLPPYGMLIFEGFPVYSEPNAYRTPYYQRLDFKISRSFMLGKTNGEYFLQIYNLLFRKNTAFHLPVSSIWDNDVILGLPILPTLGISFEF